MLRPVEGLLVVQKYLFYMLFVLKFPWMSEQTPKPLLFLWECLSWINVFLPLHMTICITKTVFDKFRTESLITLTQIGVEGAWFFFSFLGMLHYKNRQNDLVDLMNKIEANFKWRSARGRTYVDLEKIHKFAKYISIFWQCAPISTVIGSIVKPLFDHPMSLPVPSWYPINQNNPYLFVLAFCIQGWAKLVMVSSFASGSSLYISFSLLCCGQFNILRCSLKNLIYSSGVYRRFPETQGNNTEHAEHIAEYLLAHEIEDTLPTLPQIAKGALQLNNRNLSPDDVQNLREALKSCVYHHLDIVNVCAMMEEFLNIFSFLRVAEMTLQICFLAFMYAKTSAMIPLIFIVLTFFDLFLLTYPGEHIQALSKSVGSSLMLGPWYLISKNFRNDFIIIMAFSMRPITFTAGKIWKLDSDRFTSVITTAFSYYTLLSSLDKKK